MRRKYAELSPSACPRETATRPAAAPHVNFPASGLYALACGGTTLIADGDTISSETVWNDGALGHDATGRGISVEFARPDWQHDAAAPAVTGDADPLSGYLVGADNPHTADPAKPLGDRLFDGIDHFLVDDTNASDSGVPVIQMHLCRTACPFAQPRTMLVARHRSRLSTR